VLGRRRCGLLGGGGGVTRATARATARAIDKGPSSVNNTRVLRCEEGEKARGEIESARRGASGASIYDLSLGRLPVVCHFDHLKAVLAGVAVSERGLVKGNNKVGVSVGFTTGT